VGGGVCVEVDALDDDGEGAGEAGVRHLVLGFWRVRWVWDGLFWFRLRIGGAEGDNPDRCFALPSSYT